MQVKVYKLGGTSMDSTFALKRFMSQMATRDQSPVLVVVSAFAGVTDRLIALARASRASRWGEAGSLLAQLRAHHEARAEALGVDPAVCHDTLGVLSDLTFTARVAGPGFEDAVLAYGERLSSTILSIYLKTNLGRTNLLDARQLIITDTHHGEATPLVRESAQRVEEYLRPLLWPRRIVVTQGFCGSTLSGDTTTLGRGGSDFSATLLASLLSAKQVSILTDTYGVLSADPRQVPEAQTLAHLSYDEAAALARFGAKVLHPHCLAPLKASKIPMIVSNSLGNDGPTTLVTASNPDQDRFSVSCLRDCHWMPGESGANQSDSIEVLARDEGGLAYRDCHGLNPELQGSLPVDLVYMLDSCRENCRETVKAHLEKSRIEALAFFDCQLGGGLICAVPRGDGKKAVVCLHGLAASSLGVLVR